MKFQEDCIECSKKQGIRIYTLGLEKQGIASNKDKESALRQELDEVIHQADPNLSPAELSLLAIRIGEKHAGESDPFSHIKQTTNDLALSLYPQLKKRVEEDANPFQLACQLAACGNIIDLGIHKDFDIHATIEKVIREGFKKDDFLAFVSCCNRLKQDKESPFLLYLCDNAGEIVFDRLFIETIQQHYPTFTIWAVVRGHPVLNDATRDDARYTGLEKIVPVIDNGNSDLGTVLSKTHDDVRSAFAQADIIVSKGQANYETLSERPENIFYILKAKCEVIADALGVELWDAVMIQNHHDEKKGSS